MKLIYIYILMFFQGGVSSEHRSSTICEALIVIYILLSPNPQSQISSCWHLLWVIPWLVYVLWQEGFIVDLNNEKLFNLLSWIHFVA